VTILLAHAHVIRYLFFTQPSADFFFTGAAATAAVLDIDGSNDKEGSNMLY
jgi:hypothetical protein